MGVRVSTTFLRSGSGLFGSESHVERPISTVVPTVNRLKRL
jgi:hypothetical protein